MKSPFEIFRKHQKMLTVILTGLAMFAFVILGAVQDPGNMPPTLVAIFLAGVVGGIGWIAGIRAKKSKEWGLSGVVVGLILGIAATLAVGPQDVVRADSGNIDQERLNYLYFQRERANQFVNRMFQRARENGAQGFQAPVAFGFGHPDDARDIVVGELLRREADRLGVEVSDESVNDFIKQVSQEKVGASDVKAVRDQLRISESQLYEILKAEIKALTMARFLYGGTTLPPESYWDFYRQMNIEQSVGIVPMPVDAFIDTSVEPPEAELQELFATYRINYPNMTVNGRLDEGNPGFRQPRKVQLAYVEIPYETVEKTVGEVSGEEIEAFYEEYYKTIPAPGTAGDTASEGADPFDSEAPIFPEMVAPDTQSSDESSAEEVPKSEEDTNSVDDRDSAVPEPSGEDAAQESASPADTDSPDRPSRDDSPPADESQDAEASLPDAVDLGLVAFFDDQEAGDQTESRQSEPAQPTTKPEELSQSKTPPPPPTPHTRPAETGEEPGEDSEVLGGPLQPRELDDELRDEIRDQILRRRTTERMQELVTEVYRLMAEDLSYFVTLPEDDPQYLSHRQAGESVRTFAEERGLVYEETPLMSFRELSQSEEYPIGRAASDSSDLRSRSVAEMAITAGPTELFRAETVLDIQSGSRFVFWKIGDEEAYEPQSLDDPGIREQVVKTWRQLRAREQARDRAKTLARQAEGIEKPLSEIFAETTVTGKGEGPVVSVVHPPRFAWLSRANPQMSPNPFNTPAPQRTELRTVPGMIGEGFMETVVNDLQPGEVGVTHSVDKSYYYVVRIDERTYGLSPDFQAFRDRFTREPLFAPFGFSDYSKLANAKQNQYRTNWAEELFERHKVDFSRLDEQQSESPS